jgi:putative DNA primase/helicase
MGTLSFLYNQPMANIIRRDLGVLMNSDYAEAVQLLGPAMCKGNLVLLYATRGLGKTWIVLKMAHSLATKTPFLLWQPSVKSRVLIFDGEMGDESISKRFWMVEGSSPSSFSFGSCFVVNYSHTGGTMWNLSDPDQQEYYKAEADDCDVVIIDNLLTCSAPLSPRDDDLSQWRRIQPLLIQWREAGKLVILVHHSGKSGQQFGTSLRENIMDTVIGLKPTRFEGETGAFELKFEKTRNCMQKDTPDLHVKLIGGDDGCIAFDWSSLEDQERIRILEMADRGMKPHLISDTLNISRAKVSRVLYEHGPKQEVGKLGAVVESFHDR